MIGLFALFVVVAGFLWMRSMQPTKTGPVLPVTTSSTTETPVEPVIADEKIEIKGKAVLENVKGNVTIFRADMQLTGKDNLVLIEGDRIVVAKDSEATMFWPGYGKTQIASESELIVTQFEQPAEKTSLKVSLQLLTGRVWTRLEKLLETDSSFDVHANDVVATVRGTSFGVKKQPGLVRVDVMEHTVEVMRFRNARTMKLTATKMTEIKDKDESLAMGTMSTQDQADPWMKQGNTKMSADELDQPVPDMPDDEIPTKKAMAAMSSGGSPAGGSGMDGQEATKIPNPTEPKNTRPVVKPEEKPAPDQKEAPKEDVQPAPEVQEPTPEPAPADEPPADEPPANDPSYQAPTQNELEAALERTNTPSDGNWTNQ